MLSKILMSVVIGGGFVGLLLAIICGITHSTLLLIFGLSVVCISFIAFIAELIRIIWE